MTPSTPARLRDGSTLYYAMLYTSDEKSAAVATLLTLCKTLAETLQDVQAADVAEKKIHWWHEEITRLYAGVPRHPATQASLAMVRRYSIDQSSFLSILEANNSEKFENAGSDQQFAERLTKDYGARLRICTQVLQATTARPGIASNSPVADAAESSPVILGLGTFDRLSQFGKLHNLGYPVFPESDYRTADLQPGKIRAVEHQKAAAQLLSHRMRFAADQLQQALNANNLGPVGIGQPLRILATLRHAQLSHWQRNNIPIHEQYVALTPVRKYWLAWRCKRTFQPNL